ncbi:ABC transporter substrate-binding protein, partial [uncultured Eggerthella sp.]
MEKSTFSRRTFIEMLGVSAAGFGLVSLAGCSSGGDTSAPSTDAGSTGTTGGAADAITYSLTADPRAVDPAYFDDGESAVVSCNIYEGLYQYGAKDAKVAPCLATDLPEISDDGLVYTIKLREGVKFHDGGDFNADAVVKSIERQLEPNRNSEMPYASFVFGEKEAGNGVEKVEAIDPTTVKITMRAASAPFVKNLAMA